MRSPQIFSPELVLNDLNELSIKIADPCNYLKGVGAPLGILPGNILCFARRDVDALLKPSPRHPVQHHRCILLVALQGAGRVCVDANSFHLQAGEAQVIFPFQFHSYMEMESDDICWLFITFESFSLDSVISLRDSASRRLGGVELILLRELVRSWLQKGSPERIALHLGLLLERLCALDPGLSGPGTSETGLLERVNKYIITRLNQPLGLKELAERLGQSESNLRKCFRSATGCSLGRHIRQLRIQKACNLLHTTSLDISQIGEECGFESVYSFSRGFKTERGISPREYRNGLV